MKTLSLTLLAIFFMSFQPVENKTDLLRTKIEQVIADKNAVVGVSLQGNDEQDTLLLQGGGRFPMQSVFKVHIGLAVLSEIDKGKLALDQLIELKREDLYPKTFGAHCEMNILMEVVLRLKS